VARVNSDWNIREMNELHGLVEIAHFLINQIYLRTSLSTSLHVILTNSFHVLHNYTSIFHITTLTYTKNFTKTTSILPPRHTHGLAYSTFDNRQPPPSRSFTSMEHLVSITLDCPITDHHMSRTEDILAQTKPRRALSRLGFLYWHLCMNISISSTHFPCWMHKLFLQQFCDSIAIISIF